MLFSIITPSFGQLDWLRMAVASVADQVLAGGNISVEHIIQDGGTPGIETFAREVGASFYRGGQEVLTSAVSDRYSLKIYSEPDLGMYDAINRGQARARGEIFAWLNSDEQYLEGTLEAVREFFSRNRETDVLLGDAVLFGENGDPICYRRIIIPSRQHTRLFHLHSLSCATFFRKSSVPVPLFDPCWRVIGDAVLIDGLLKDGRIFTTLEIPLAAYFFTGINLSAAPNGEMDIWWSALRWPSASARPFVRIWHFFRRVIAGSYRRFNVSINIYFKGSGVRRHINQRVSGRWPSVRSQKHPRIITSH